MLTVNDVTKFVLASKSQLFVDHDYLSMRINVRHRRGSERAMTTIYENELVHDIDAVYDRLRTFINDCERYDENVKKNAVQLPSNLYISGGSTLNLSGGATIIGSGLSTVPYDQVQQKLMNEQMHRQWAQEQQFDHLLLERQRAMQQQSAQWSRYLDQGSWSNQYADRPDGTEPANNVTWLSREIGRITTAGRNELAP